MGHAGFFPHPEGDERMRDRNHSGSRTSCSGLALDAGPIATNESLQEFNPGTRIPDYYPSPGLSINVNFQPMILSLLMP